MAVEEKQFSLCGGSNGKCKRKKIIIFHFLRQHLLLRLHLR